jgi:NAD(P)H-dependent FMN reductase
MMTIFSATNRSESNTENVASFYKKRADRQGLASQVYRFTDLPNDFILTETYGEPPKSFSQIQKTFIEAVDRIVFVIPEYNGSYPGITKLFLDTIHPSIWKGKKAALVGVSSGRAGNLRGMDQLATVLNYLKMEVYSLKIPLSSIEKNIDASGELVNPEYIDLLDQQIEAFSKF